MSAIDGGPVWRDGVGEEVQVRVLLYGQLRDAVGCDIDLDAPDGSSIAALRDRLANSHPQAAAVLRRLRRSTGLRRAVGVLTTPCGSAPGNVSPVGPWVAAHNA